MLKTASMRPGFTVLAGARALEDRATLQEAARKAEAVGASACLYGRLETLKYVKSSGAHGSRFEGWFLTAS